jgi:uncharacterized protein
LAGVPNAAAVSRRTLDLAGTQVPLVEVTGAADGPLLTVLAGVHGCEYASIAAVRRWTRNLEARELAGRVRAVPVLNIPAFRARTPFVVPEDGKNLNRCFPGDPAGTLAERLAHDAFTEVISGSDALVDAHCGDLVEALQPFSLYDAGPAEDRALDLARAYGLPYVIRQEPGPDRAVAGSTSAAAAQAGIPAIIAEAGGCGLVEEHAVRQHVDGLDRVLVVLGMAAGGWAVSGPAAGLAAAGLAAGGWAAGGSGAGGSGADAGPEPAREPVQLGRFLWLRSASAGWWEPAVGPGEAVAAGQAVGTITSLDGADVLETIPAPADGVVMFLTSSPAVAREGLLLGLGAR